MRSHLDFWRPSKRQLEALADCVAAGLDTARTARVLGVSEGNSRRGLSRHAATSWPVGVGDHRALSLV
jgi:hypothetical protein